jgi:hypothetical protein
MSAGARRILVSKLIRFDEDHYGYLVDHDLTEDHARTMSETFRHAWPGKRLIIMQADEFIDLTGQYQIVPTADPVGPSPLGLIKASITDARARVTRTHDV